MTLLPHRWPLPQTHSRWVCDSSEVQLWTPHKKYLAVISCKLWVCKQNRLLCTALQTQLLKPVSHKNIESQTFSLPFFDFRPLPNKEDGTYLAYTCANPAPNREIKHGFPINQKNSCLQRVLTCRERERAIVFNVCQSVLLCWWHRSGHWCTEKQVQPCSVPFTSCVGPHRHSHVSRSVPLRWLCRPVHISVRAATTSIWNTKLLLSPPNSFLFLVCGRQNCETLCCFHVSSLLTANGTTEATDAE